MRNSVFSIWLFVALITFFSCGAKKNPTEPQLNNKDSMNQTSHNEKVNPDEDFVKKAAEGGLYEVMLGDLAARKGKSSKIWQLGRMMSEDHGKANDDLRKLAKEKHLSMPNTLGNDKQAIYDKLAKKEGADFDRAYARQMVDDHHHDIKEFEQEAENGEDPDLKKFASDKLPTLRHHLKMSEEAVEHCEKTTKR